MKDYSEYGFREHGVMLYLDKTLYKAFIRLQADKELGRSYAGLLAFVEGLFRLGYLSKEEYEKYVQKYSCGLKEASSVKVEVETTKIQVQKSTVQIKSVDYSKFSDDELLEAYEKALKGNDVVAPNLIQGEALKRGYRFKVDNFGKVVKVVKA